MNFTQFNRETHRWGSLVAALPILVVILTGLLLLLKKEIEWIQPASHQGTPQKLTLGFNQILEISKTVPEAQIEGWGDIDRLDVRPNKGVLKVRARNRWEIQLDTYTGEILNVAYRRSDLIEQLHDGSFFHKNARLWIFLPSALMLLILWMSGLYLGLLHIYRRRKRRVKKTNP